VTFQPKAPHKKPRWLILAILVMSFSVVPTALVIGHGATSIPSNYAGGVQVDVHGANDVPGQVDVTQMGRDTSANPNVRIFWSWDSISAWTGSGQTGDACALFDTADADAFINYVVCARVQNLNANPDFVQILPASANHPVYLFDCSNKKNDRCTNPAPRAYTAGQVTAGPFGALSQTGTGNAISETDPFDSNALNGPGESYPHDSSIEVLINSALVPSGVSLANVCSYPSAGNGGNNNPFDCIVTPGVQYGTLVVNKTLTNDNGGSAAVTDFSYKVNGGTAIPFEADGSNSATVPVGTYSIVEDGLPITGYTTTYANDKNANTNCTSLSVTVGGTTTCTITNDDDIASPTISTAMKWTLNDEMTLTGFVSGGEAVNITFHLFKDTATLSSCEASTEIYSEAVALDDTTGTAATATGWTTKTTGTYRWIASFPGNSFNAGIDSDCGDEVTTLP
jgi:hypothetical protein